MTMRWRNILVTAMLGCFSLTPLLAVTQDTTPPKDASKKSQDDKPVPPPRPGDRPRGPGGFTGPMGPGGSMERKVVKQFDKDGDGRLNKEERKAAREFLKKDGGRRSFGPGGGVMFFGGGMAKQMVPALDTDKDGKVSKAELTAGIKAFFADCDADKKGFLTQEQITRGLGRHLPAPRDMMFGPDGPPPGGPDGPPGERRGGPPPQGQGGPPPQGPDGPPGNFRVFAPGEMFARGIVQKADANKDNKVTLEELLAALEQPFKEADKNSDGKLDEQELETGIGQVMPTRPFGRGPGGPGGGTFIGPAGMGGGREPGKPGRKLTPAEVENHPDAPLYEPTVLRTLFLEFEDKDWEAEMADFYHTDVEMPAILTVDGKKYPDVGVHFRGASSFFGVQAGSKRSLNLSLDFVNDKQRLGGYKTLNLLNLNDDPSFLNTVLYSHIARQHIPVPKANLVRVVINGECWGVYTNVQQFNKEFLTENYKNSKGARWKVKGSPGGGGGLDYISENVEDYKRRYEIKSGDDEKSWKALIALCKTLSKTPTDQLEEALKPMLDIDGVLWFLALDNVLINCDGYWIRASDYSLYLDPKGKFHMVPHDMNEAFRQAMGPGMGRGPGGPGGRPGGPGGQGGPGGDQRPAPAAGAQNNPFALDPLVGMDDLRKPLRSRLLAVPSLRTRYLQYVRVIAEESLDWKKLGPVVAQYRALIEKDVEADTRKLTSFIAFQRATADSVVNDAPPAQGRRPSLSLRTFADQRRKFLLEHPEVKKVPPLTVTKGSKKSTP
jgi:spore coat protein CotH